MFQDLRAEKESSYTQVIKLKMKSQKRRLNPAVKYQAIILQVRAGRAQAILNKPSTK